MLKRFYVTDYKSIEENYDVKGCVYADSLSETSPYFEENLHIEEINHYEGRWMLTICNNCWGSDDLLTLEEKLIEFARGEGFEIPTDGFGPFTS